MTCVLLIFNPAYGPNGRGCFSSHLDLLILVPVLIIWFLILYVKAKNSFSLFFFFSGRKEAK